MIHACLMSLQSGWYNIVMHMFGVIFNSWLWCALTGKVSTYRVSYGGRGGYSSISVRKIYPHALLDIPHLHVQHIHNQIFVPYIVLWLFLCFFTTAPVLLAGVNQIKVIFLNVTESEDNSEVSEAERGGEPGFS